MSRTYTDEEYNAMKDFKVREKSFVGSKWNADEVRNLAINCMFYGGNNVVQCWYCEMRFVEFTDITAFHKSQVPMCVSHYITKVPGLNDEHLKKYTRYRYKTFKWKWRVSYAVQAKKLAKAGFYYVGPRDIVACAYCQELFGSWRYNSDPLEVHKINSPKCPRLVTEQLIPKRAILTVQEMDELGILPHKPYNPLCYQTMAMRIETFMDSGNWPDTKPDPKNMANAGFVLNCYETDLCLCWHCKSRIKTWHKYSEPCNTHMDLSSKCLHARSRVTSSKRLKPDLSTSIVGPPGSDDEQIMCTMALEVVDELAALEIECIGFDMESFQQKFLCKICLSFPRVVVLMPCGHLACCGNCITDLAACPIGMCRKNFVAHVFINQN